MPPPELPPLIGILGQILSNSGTVYRGGLEGGRGRGICVIPSWRNGRAGGIRTRGLFVPNEALYQAEPQPVNQGGGNMPLKRTKARKSS